MKGEFDHMNNLTKGIIGLSIFAAGYGIGYVVSKKMFERELDEINRRDREELNELRNRRIEVKYPQDIEDVDLTDMPEEEVDDPEHDTSRDYNDDPFAGMTKDEIEVARKQHQRIITNYAAMYKPSIDEVAENSGIKQTSGRYPWKDDNDDIEDDEPDEYEDAETDEERELREMEALNRVDSEHPYIIEPEQFDSECDHYDKIELYYYVKDDTLCDTDDTPLSDTEDYDDALAKLEMQTNVYVRNEQVGADYAIYRVNKSYASDVAGIAETPAEREYRHLARRKSIMDGDY